MAFRARAHYTILQDSVTVARRGTPCARAVCLPSGPPQYAFANFFEKKDLKLCREKCSKRLEHWHRCQYIPARYILQWEESRTRCFLFSRTGTVKFLYTHAWTLTKHHHIAVLRLLAADSYPEHNEKTTQLGLEGRLPSRVTMDKEITMSLKFDTHETSSENEGINHALTDNQRNKLRSSKVRAHALYPSRPSHRFLCQTLLSKLSLDLH